MKYPGVIVLMDSDMTIYTALPLTFIRALKQIGCPAEAVFFEVNIRSYRLIYEFFPWFNRTYLRAAQDRILAQVSASESDVVLVVKGVFLLAETIEKMKAMGKRVYCYNPDDPFQTEFGTSNRNIRSCIPHYDGYFIWGRKVMELVKNAGCAEVHYMPFAVDDTIIKPIPEERKGDAKPMDISFIGGGNGKRVKLIKYLLERLDSNVNISVFGHDWPKIPGVAVHRGVFGDEYLNVMYQSKINLNILREQNEGANNMRTFEIPATGCFMLHEYSEEAIGFFKEGTEAEYYRDNAECVEKINDYLENEIRRLEIAEAGYKKVFKAGHLYINLMEDMVLKMGLAQIEN